MITRQLLIPGLVLLLAGILAPGTMGQEPASGNDSKRIHRLFAEFKCKCPKEDWTRTLAGCFEPCVDPQRALVRKLVADGLTDEEIRDRMIQDAGTEKVIAQTSALPNLIPSAIFIVLGCGVVLLLLRMRKQTLSEAAAGGYSGEGPESLYPEEGNRVEDELSRLKD